MCGRVMLRQKKQGDEDLGDLADYIGRVITAHAGTAPWDTLLQMEDKAQYEMHRRFVGKNI